MKQFNKVKLLSHLGLLACKFDRTTGRFEKSVFLRLRSLLILFLIISFPFKFYLSVFFRREDPIQLRIGNVGVLNGILWFSIVSNGVIRFLVKKALFQMLNLCSAFSHSTIFRIYQEQF